VMLVSRILFNFGLIGVSFFLSRSGVAIISLETLKKLFKISVKY
jgi:hypothetical protein